MRMSRAIDGDRSDIDAGFFSEAYVKPFPKFPATVTGCKNNYPALSQTQVSPE